MSVPSGLPAPSGAVRGGDAWVVPFEAGGAVWVTASAPEIRVLDRRAAKAQPAVHESAVPASLAR